MLNKNNLYWKGEKLKKIVGYSSIDDWVGNREFYMLDFFPWEVNANNYKDIIEKNFIHIGITENIQRSVDIFADKLGFPRIKIPRINTTERSEKPSEKSILKFKEKCRTEYLIYNFVKELNA